MIIILIISVSMFVHSGALIERSKNVCNTKFYIKAAVIEFLISAYFLVAAIGALNGNQ